MKNNEKQTTFWNLILNNKIEIPIIQRDYAQGRKGEEELRKKFIYDLKLALCDKKPLVLDFVYASIENERVNPLDGQQRLTTLWLLHWYIAYRADKLDDKVGEVSVRDVLKNFSYETRISSREFIEKLCDYNNKNEIGGLVADIKNQTWFYSEWEQDPTIQSMLTTLGGNKEKDSKGQEIIGDGFEEAFTQDDNFMVYWESLIRDEIILFYYLPLDDFGLSDDLYIKMNARGKALTPFENFKADLVGYIYQQAKENKEWLDLVDVEKGIPIKLDTSCTDIFWKNKSEGRIDEILCIPIKLDTSWTDIFWKNKSESRIDEIYYAFINRYLLNAFIIHSDKSVEDIEKDSCFTYLYGEKGNDTYIKYTSFDKYKLVLNKKVLEKLDATLNNISQYIKGCKSEDFQTFNANVITPPWDKKSTFRFIPEYENAGSITTLTQPQRVMFLAVCKYFETNGYDKDKFEDWMRVAWNIVENAKIENVSAMIGAMRLINELGEKSGDILSFLSDQGYQIKSDAAKEQVAEEIEKAKLIVRDKSWREKITEAEKYAFFNGAIRFLLRNADGKYDSNNFDQKWQNAQSYFDNQGSKICDAKLLRRFVVLAGDKWTEIIYDEKPASWRKSLLNSNLTKAIDDLLSCNDVETFDYDNYTSCSNDLKWKYARELLVRTRMLTKVEEGCLLHYKSFCKNSFILHPYNAKKDEKFYILNPRTELLFGNEKISFRDSNLDKCREIKLMRGKNIDFRYEYKPGEYYRFRWWSNANNEECDIYLMCKEETGNWDYVKRNSLLIDKRKKDENIYYCTDVNEYEINQGDFNEILSRLIGEYLEDTGKLSSDTLQNE